jgi:hypothetical protein
MYVLQDEKLYCQLGDNKVVGVEIYSDHISKVDGTETVLGPNYTLLTKQEVLVKFQIDQHPYFFPKENKVEIKKEVVTNEPVGTVQKPTRKSTRK